MKQGRSKNNKNNNIHEKKGERPNKQMKKADMVMEAMKTCHQHHQQVSNSGRQHSMEELSMEEGWQEVKRSGKSRKPIKQSIFKYPIVQDDPKTHSYPSIQIIIKN